MCLRIGVGRIGPNGWKPPPLSLECVSHYVENQHDVWLWPRIGLWEYTGPCRRNWSTCASCRIACLIISELWAMLHIWRVLKWANVQCVLQHAVNQGWFLRSAHPFPISRSEDSSMCESVPALRLAYNGWIIKLVCFWQLSLLSTSFCL